MSYFHKFVEFSKAMFTTVYCKKLFALAPTNHRWDLLKKIGLVGTLELIYLNFFCVVLYLKSCN